MDEVVKLKPVAPPFRLARPSREQAEAAVRTLIAWAGDDPEREGLVDTPRRVAKAYEELYAGYREDPEKPLRRVFHDVSGFEDLVLVRDIAFVSHCEHHMAPFFGKAHVGYFPKRGVVGLSKLARIVDTFARRLQTQEALSAQIVQAIEKTLGARGVAVMLEAEHTCMAMRGVQARPAPRPSRPSSAASSATSRTSRRVSSACSAARGDGDDAARPSARKASPFSRNSAPTGSRPASPSTPRDGDVLMVAHMNAEALEATLSTGFVHYWSRSRGALWRKGDTSGQSQTACRAAGRLRPGRLARFCRGRRRRRRLPYRPPLLLLPPGRGRRVGARLAFVGRGRVKWAAPGTRQRFERVVNPELTGGLELGTSLSR